MSLQIKFLLLVGTLLLAVIGSVSAASWALSVVHREVATPFDQMSITLGELARIKRYNEAIRSTLSSPSDTGAPTYPVNESQNLADFRSSKPPTETDRLAVMDAAAGAGAHVAALEQNHWYRSRIGVSTWINIRKRLDAVTTGAQTWLDGADEAHRIAACASAFQLHELIEKTELRILDDARTAVGHSAWIARRLSWLLAAVTLGAMLGCSLAVILLRRWVQRPVGELRRAAARIAAGDFSHRVVALTNDELGQLMSEVNHMAGMVDQFQREAVERERLAAIGQMVRRIVHNVRNPLAGIRGLAEITRLDTPDGSEHRENMSLIVSTVDTFERWLSLLLETTRPMDLNYVKVSLVPWASEILRAHEPGARSKGVGLVLNSETAPVVAEFDPRHLEHALAAVVANAVDASPPNSSVSVRISARDEEDLIEFSVQDQGSGVPPDLRERIFEPHFTTKARGTGIGLAIARQILVSHGGSITLDPPQTPGTAASGACFRLRVPLRAKRAVLPVAEISHQTG